MVTYIRLYVSIMLAFVAGAAIGWLVRWLAEPEPVQVEQPMWLLVDGDAWDVMRVAPSEPGNVWSWSDVWRRQDGDGETWTRSN